MPTPRETILAALHARLATLPAPTPEERRAALAPLSRRQVFIGMHRRRLISGPEAIAAARTGEVPAAIEALFAALPEPEATEARITFAAFTEVLRLDPITTLLQGADAACMRHGQAGTGADEQ